MNAPVLAYIPGSVRFTYPAREQRSATCRTWHGRQDMGWCWECLLCGDWADSCATRAQAERVGAVTHPTWCHVVQGCHCATPHITAAMAARLGISGEFPRHLAGILFRLAGGIRKPLPRPVDKYGYPYACQHCDQAGKTTAAGQRLALGALPPGHQWTGSRQKAGKGTEGKTGSSERKRRCGDRKTCGRCWRFPLS